MFKGKDEEERIIIPDEDGNEEVFNVLLKFDVKETGKQYILLTPADQDGPEVTEQEVYAFRYEESGDAAGDRERINLYLIEDDEEWDMVEATFQTLLEENVFDDIH
jgi:uncharacterized protein YrzB (UPF0473 family)